MRNRRTSRVLACFAAAGFGVCAWAGPAPAPRDYVARIDGVPVVAVAPDGRSWSVWAYRASGEFDIAVSVREPSGAWGTSSFVGRRDGVDQMDPALAIDAAGNVYVAYATRTPQRIYTTILVAGETTWSEPALISPEVGASPALRIVGDRIVLAYRTSRGIRMVDFPLLIATPDGIQDGPDTSGPLGNSGGNELPIGDGDNPPPPPPSDDPGSSS